MEFLAHSGAGKPPLLRSAPTPLRLRPEDFHLPVAQPAGKRPVGRREIPAGVLLAPGRITSYNVCYTKLLRLLTQLLRQVRPDVKILGNYLLERIPQMRELIIPVDPFDQDRSARRNIAPVRQAIRYVRDVV